MRRASQRAVELETDGLSPFFAMAHLGLGHAAYVTGELNLATEQLSTANLCEAAPAIVKVLGLSVQSLAEGELGRHERSRELAERAMEIVDARQLHVMPQAAAGVRGPGPGAGVVGQGERCHGHPRAGAGHAAPSSHRSVWTPIHHVMVMARVAVQAGEVSMAQELLSDLSARMIRFPDGMAAMRARQAVIEAALRESIAAGADVEQLTDAGARRPPPAPGLVERSGDRLVALPVTQHGEEPREGPLSEARCPLA